MNLPDTLTQACRQGRLALLWGTLPFPLAERSPANRALALKRWAEDAGELPPPGLPLGELPPLPILSLDPTDRVERAFTRAGVSLQVVRTRHDVPARGRHALLKLAGDLKARAGVVLSRAELRELHSDPRKRYLLDQARQRARGGALLLLGCDPASADFRAWWSVLAPALRDAAFFAVGEEPGAAWPEDVALLGPDFQALSAALWAAQPPPSVELPPSPQPPTQAKYIINFYGPVTGPAVGDEARVEQHFAASVQTTRGSWEELIAQVTARMDALSAQLGQGVDDLKRGQAALYRQVDQAYRDDLARVLAAVQQGRMEQGEMQATLDALRRALRAVATQGPPVDAELRAAVADLTEAVESSLRLERKLELSLPLIPLFLDYKIELAVDSQIDLHALWDELRSR